MNERNYILFFLGILGAFNGFILGIFLLFLTRRKSLSNYFLGALLLALSIRIGKSVFVSFNPGLAKTYLQIGLTACYLIGPFLYYYVRSVLEQPGKLPSSWKWSLIGLTGIIVLVGLLYPYATYPIFWNYYMVKVIYAVWLVYVVAAVAKSKTVLFRLFSTQGRAGLKTGEKWLLTVLLANVVIFTCLFLALVQKQFTLYFGGALIFSFLLYAVVFILLYRKQKESPPHPVAAKPAIKKVNDAEASVVLRKLEQLMTEQEIYKNPNLTLGDLAKAVEVSSHQLSAVLNDHAGKNFTSYINEYRVNKACAMIAANHPFSLEAIGYEVGFNSKSTFYASFKKVKGTTPSLYKESLEKTASL